MQKANKNTDEEMKTVVENEPAWVKRVLDLYERIKRNNKRNREIDNV